MKATYLFLENQKKESEKPITLQKIIYLFSISLVSLLLLKSHHLSSLVEKSTIPAD